MEDPDTSVTVFLRSLGLQEYSKAFSDHAIDAETLSTLTNADLQEIGVRALGHRKRILAAIAAASIVPSVRLTAIEGELKLVTVFFADIVDSTSLVSSLDAEGVKATLDPIIGQMSSAIERYAGTVIRVAGDGLLAVFGAPSAREDHAVCACHAALALHSITAQKRSASTTESPIRLRIGLHSGEVIFTQRLDSNGRAIPDVVGPAVWLAARIQQAAPPDGTFLSRSTVRLVDRFFVLSESRAIEARGFPAPQIVSLLGVPKSRSGGSSEVSGRFVGREIELRALLDAAARAGSGRGNVVAIVGEPGVGKSRLVDEFIPAKGLDGFRVMKGGAASIGEIGANRALIDMLSTAIGMPESRSTAELIAALQSRDLGRALPDRAIADLLLTLLDQPRDISNWDRLSPPDRRELVVRCVQQAMHEVAHATPLVVVFEDLHWIDESARGLLDAIINLLPAIPALVVLTYRPDFSDRWNTRSYHSRLWLEPFSSSAAELFLGDLIGTDPSLKDLKARLIGRTAGNALFLGETVRSLIESGAVARNQQGNYGLARPIQEIQVPDSVQSIVTARLDQRSAEERNILQVASVIGAQFSIEFLQSLVERPLRFVAPALSALEAAELIHQIHSAPATEYAFKHALIREGAYRSMLRQRRRELHLAAMRYLESASTDRAVNVDQLAYHSLQAEQWTHAVDYNRRAAARAEFRSSYREAIGYLEAATDAADRLPPGNERTVAAIDVRLDMRTAFYASSEFHRLEEHAALARSLAESLGDDRRAGLAIADQALCMWRRGALSEGLEAARQVQAIASRLEDPELRAMAAFGMGQVSYALGHYREAIEPLRTMIALGGEDPASRSFLVSRHAIHARSFLACTLAELGRFEEAAQVAREGMSFAQQMRDGFADGFSRYSAAYVELRRGDNALALDLMQPALDDSLRRRVIGFLAFLASSSGIALVRLGRTEEGVSLAERGVAAMDKRHEYNFQLPFVFLSEVYLVAGRYEDAYRIADQSVNSCHQRGESGYESWAFSIFAAACHKLGRTNEAIRSRKEAVSIAEKLGQQPVIEFCRRELGDLQDFAT